MLRAGVYMKYLKSTLKAQKVEVIPDAKRAARYYYLIRCSFNNNPSRKHL